MPLRRARPGCRRRMRGPRRRAVSRGACPTRRGARYVHSGARDRPRCTSIGSTRDRARVRCRNPPRGLARLAPASGGTGTCRGVRPGRHRRVAPGWSDARARARGGSDLVAQYARVHPDEVIGVVCLDPTLDGGPEIRFGTSDAAEVAARRAEKDSVTALALAAAAEALRAEYAGDTQAVFPCGIRRRSRGTLLIATDANHFVHHGAAGLSTEAVRRVLAAATRSEVR